MIDVSAILVRAIKLSKYIDPGLKSHVKKFKKKFKYQLILEDYMGT